MSKVNRLNHSKVKPAFGKIKKRKKVLMEEERKRCSYREKVGNSASF